MLSGATATSAWAQDDDQPDGDGRAKQAQDSPESERSDTDRPWAENVAKDVQERANQQFATGNRALDEGDFGDAEEAFSAALELWNHPAIQYNLVLALIGNKGDPVRIYKALEQATRYGAAPLDPARFERAQEYQDIYGKQLARITLRCDEPDTKVTLDGKLVLTGPGRFEDVVTVGEHAISATKPGYIAINRTRILNPEDDERIDLVMYTVEDKTRYERRFAPWVPWTTAGGGLAVLAAGGALNYLSIQNRQKYNDLIELECPDGCPAGTVDSSLQDSANQQRIGAYVGYALGGVGVAVGVVMIFLNQPKKIVEIDDDERVSVVPFVSPGSVGATAAVRF